MTLEDFLKVVSPDTRINVAVIKEECITGAFGYKQKVMQELMHFGICTLNQYEIYSISHGNTFVIGDDEEDVIAKEN